MGFNTSVSAEKSLVFKKYGNKIFLSNALFLTFLSPVVWQLHSHQRPALAFLFTSDCEITFSKTCNKFAVECDWNSKESQNTQS